MQAISSEGRDGDETDFAPVKQFEEVSRDKNNEDDLQRDGWWIRMRGTIHSISPAVGCLPGALAALHLPRSIIM